MEQIIQLFLCLFIELIYLFDNLQSLFNVFQILEGVRSIMQGNTSVNRASIDSTNGFVGAEIVAKKFSLNMYSGNVVSVSVIAAKAADVIFAKVAASNVESSIALYAVSANVVTTIATIAFEFEGIDFPFKG
jgi:hypothetical protein